VHKTIDEIVAEAAAEPLPVLLPDTCALLDIVRAPTLRHNAGPIVAAARRLLAFATASAPGLRLFVASIVLDEFHQILQSERDAVSRILARLQDDMTRMQSVESALRPELAERVPFPPGPAPAATADLLRGLAHDLATAAGTIGQRDACVVSANERLLRARPPASHHRQQYKDCVIFEHYLQLARELRAAGVQRPVVFVSSNVGDYGQPGQLDASLQAELDGAGVVFVTDLAWAHAHLFPATP
jgi:hypothetical protein